MVEVGTYPTRSDAELAQTALTAAGIPSVVSSDDAGGAYPFDLSGGARLLVDEADVQDASMILDTQTGRTR
jgi:Putative prokaryotic signal transducing protein